jgi:hypothetical protein
MLEVTSHVGRDLLQSAALFRHEHAVAWEYASNGLQYVDPGVHPVVRIQVDQDTRSLTIIDNGRGMSIQDLARYFTMHGENEDRRRGLPGRGMFGTGKSAAFGIANRLRVTTVRNGKRSKVQLDRKAIESPEAKSSVPIQILESEIPTDEPNGTLVEVLNVNLRRLDVASIIREIERHIAHWPNATVFVGHQKCEYIEPATAAVERVSTTGTPFEAGLPGIELVLKTAKAPLTTEQQGVAITSCGVLHETTLAGCDRRAFSNYVFGSIEVPSLATDTSPIPPFDMARTMRLNPQNETVALIHAFLGMNIERVCQRLEQEDRQRRRTEEVKRLQKEANAIADLINQDFTDWRSRIQQVLSQTSGSSDQKPSIVAGDGDDLGGEGDIPATEVAPVGGVGGGGGTPHVNPEPANSGPTLERTNEGEKAAGTRARDPNSRARGGGFNVDFRPMGVEEARAKYESNERTIIVNLDHPQITAALSVGGIEDAAFRRLAYEVAFSEYAIGLAVELARSGYFIEMRQPITEIRDTMNRLATRAAALYR